MKLRNLVTTSLGSHIQTESPPAFYSQNGTIHHTQNAQTIEDHFLSFPSHVWTRFFALKVPEEG